MPSAKRTRAVLFCLLFPPWFFAFETCAAGPFSIESEIGFHGLFQLGRPFPIRVVVGNAGPPATGTVEVSVWRRRTSPATGLYPLRYRKEVVLPASARKTVLFTIDTDSLSRPLDVRFLNSQDNILQQVDLRRHFSPAPVVLLATERGHFTAPLPQGFQNPVVSLSLGDLPVDARSYGGVSAVLFYEQSLRDLSAAQTAALESWLSAGGRVVILGSLHYALYQEPMMSGLLPVKVRGIKRIPSARSLEAAYGTEGGILKDLWAQEVEVVSGEVVLEAEGTPIVVKLGRGKGDVVYLSLDPGRPPLSRWDGLAPLFADLLRASPEPQPVGRAVWNDRIAVQLLSDAYFSHAPAAPFFFWLALYVAGLGLWGWLWHRRKVRRKTLLLFFFLFVGSASAAGHLHLDQSGSPPDGVLLTARIVDALSDGYVEVQTNLALFAARGRSYEIVVESGWTGFDVGDPPLDRASDAPLLIQNDLDSSRFRFPLKAWDHRLFRLRAVRRFPIQAEARHQGEAVRIELANQSLRGIRDCWVVLFGKPFYWGTLPPGTRQAREFPLEAEEGLRHKTVSREIRFDNRTRDILFHHSFFPEGWEAGPWGEGALFFGWVDEEPPRAGDGDERISPYRHTFYRAKIPLGGWDGEGP